MPILNVSIAAAPNAALSAKVAVALGDLTARILGKSRAVTAVAIRYIDPEHWFAGGQSLAAQGKSSFHLDIKVTDSTTTKDEKARSLAEVFAAMAKLIGPLHEESYILVHDVRADAYGYGGLTQEHRYVAGQLATKDASATATQLSAKSQPSRSSVREVLHP